MTCNNMHLIPSECHRYAEVFSVQLVVGQSPRYVLECLHDELGTVADPFLFDRIFAAIVRLTLSAFVHHLRIHAHNGTRGVAGSNQAHAPGTGATRQQH